MGFFELTLIAAEVEIAEARRAFEARWTYWNSLRTVVACLATLLLLCLILRL